MSSHWSKNLDPQTKSVVLQEASMRQNAALNKPAVDPLITERISYINNRAPWIPANTQLSLAKNYASDQAVDKAAELYSRNLNDNPASVGQLSSQSLQYLLSDKVNAAVKAVAEGQSVDKSFFEEEKDLGNLLPDLYGGFKQTSRVLGALSMGAPELLQNVFSLGTLGTKEGRQRSYSIKDSLESFSLFQLLNNWDDQGEGFFITEELQAQQSEAARRTRGMVNGSAFSIGRGMAASLHLPENSIWYTGVSGFLDLMVQIAVPEPTKYVFKGAKVATLGARNIRAATAAGGDLKEVLGFARGIVPSITKVDAKAYKEALSADAGLGRSITGLSLDVQKWDRFMNTNKQAVKAINEIVGESDELAIAEKFNWKLAPEQIQRLAKANTAAKVKAELVGPYAMGANTLSTKIQDIQTGVFSNPLKWTVEKTMGSSRLLSQMPGSQLVINGSQTDRINAVKNMHLSLKAAGATREVLSDFTKKALDKFKSVSSSDDQYEAYGVYKLFLKETLKLNGVKDEVINGLFERVRRNRENLRGYMTDRMGSETDLGYMKVYGDLLKKHFPQSVWNEFMEQSAELGQTTMAFARPMQLSQLFDRVQSLPDARELRRLTSNPFFREVLEKTTGRKGKFTKPFVSKFRRMEIQEIIDQDRYDEIQTQLNSFPKKGTNDQALETSRRLLEQEQDSLVKVSNRRVYTGEQSIPIAVLDGLQNAIWKPLNLATIGYIMRNAIDAQVRMAIGGSTGILSHPGEYISLLLGETRSASKLLALAKKYDLSTKERSILGEQLTVKGPRLWGKDKEKQNVEIQEEWKRLREEHNDLLQLTMRRQGMNEIKTGQHLHFTGDWRTVSKLDNEKAYGEAVLDNLRLINEDDLQRTAAQGLIFNKAEDELLDELATVAGKAENFRQIDGIYSRGIGFKSKQGDSIQGPGRSLLGLSPEARKEWLREHAKNVSYTNVKNMTGDIQDVTFIAAFDRVPVGERITLDLDSVLPKYSNEEIKLGTFVKLSNDGEGVIVSLDNTGAVVQPVIKGTATGKETYKYSKDALRLIKRTPVRDPSGVGKGLNSDYLKQQTAVSPEGKKWAKDIAEGLDTFTNFFFQELYGQKFVKTLERSPVFRKFYYEEIGNQIGRLATSEAQALLAKLEKSAKNAGFSGDIGKYIGSQDTAAKLRRVASTPGNGTLKASDLDDYARLVGVTKTKDLLYDATEKNNLEDSLRIIFPFVGAWREIVGTYIGFTLEDPGRLARVGRYTNILGSSDPDGDGRGFWYEDPQSGDAYFKFPEIFGLPAALRAAGVKSFFEAPVAQLSQGTSWIPGIGPLAQIPASFIFRNKPETSQIVRTLLPYGKTGLKPGEIIGQFNPVPGTVSKTASLLYSFIDENSLELNKTFASTLKDVVRAKYASGDYDFSTEEGFKKLESDSIRDARIISAIRIAQQFVGPTSPQIGFTIEVQDKDIYVDEMVKVFSKMQEEDYDSAVPRFLNVFGNEAALYIGSKSETLVPGLEATGEFGEWELKNKDLLEQYPTVASYFAPQGSEFNFDVYKRQEGEGKRRKLTVKEMVELAQNRIGSAKFRAARKMFGAFPSEPERERLAAYRLKLNREYPGFKPVAEFTVGEYPNQLIQLRDILKDPRLAKNEIVPYVERYLAARDSLLMREDLKGFDSLNSAPLAETLYAFGNRLAAENAQFDRIWQRLLSSEVEK
jgi:hypothetical protein